MNENLILIFTRNPELGKVKTRLAKGVGDVNALAIYKILLDHTQQITSKVQATKRVMYSETIVTNDLWSNYIFEKKAQVGDDLGERMHNAFAEGFANGYQKIVIIGSDMYDLTTNDIEHAFDKLEDNDIVIGPAEDGGYYLLGMKAISENLFKNKEWGTDTVLKDTLKDIKNLKYYLLKEKNDIDTFEDIKDIPVFKKYIK